MYVQLTSLRLCYSMYIYIYILLRYQLLEVFSCLKQILYVRLLYEYIPLNKEEVCCCNTMYLLTTTTTTTTIFTLIEFVCKLNVTVNNNDGNLDYIIINNNTLNYTIINICMYIYIINCTQYHNRANFFLTKK